MLIHCPNGTSAGSLAADTAGYYDEVYYSPAEGALVETSTSFGREQQYPVSNDHLHSRRPYVRPATSSTAPNTVGSIVFKRRWIIEQDLPVTGYAGSPSGDSNESIGAATGHISNEHGAP